MNNISKEHQVFFDKLQQLCKEHNVTITTEFYYDNDDGFIDRSVVIIENSTYYNLVVNGDLLSIDNVIEE